MKPLHHQFVYFSILALFSSVSFGVEVKMKSLGYDPKQVEIKVGESVVWKNTAYTEHSATSDTTPPVFDTGRISPGKGSRSIKFEKAGQYEYHCSIHGKTMSGIIVVK